MASLAPSTCCMTLQGDLHEGETHVHCYIKFTIDKNTHDATLFYTDIIGHKLQNSTLIADQFAANGYFVAMPDLFHGDPVPLDRPDDYDLYAWLRGPPGHMPEQVDPVVDAVSTSMREEYGCKRIGGVGYCFGAKYVVRQLGAPGLLQTGYICTPSLIEAAELRSITAPLSIAAAEQDTVFPREKRIESENILKDEVSLPYQMTLYGRIEHGFGCKADIKVPEKKFAKDLAFLQALVWMDNYVRGEPLFKDVSEKASV